MPNTETSRTVALFVLFANVVAAAIGCTDVHAAPGAFVQLCPDDPGAVSRPDWPGSGCDAPADISVDAIETLPAFRVAASALVCDWSLRCGLSVTDVYCHPRYAELEAQRAGVDPDLAYDIEAGRACLRALLDANTCGQWLAGAVACQALSRDQLDHACVDDVDCSFLAECRDGHCVWLAENEPCAVSCAPGLACIHGGCHIAAGCSCEADDDCGQDVRCRAGSCRFAARGEVCTGANDCAAGLVCGAAGTCVSLPALGEACRLDDGCAIGACVGGSCVARHHVGCACERDDECPRDVAVCADGVCALRPLRGEACEVEGPPCYASRCEARRCEPWADGEGPCVADVDCALGLTCSAHTTATSGRCGPPRGPGSVCGPTLPGGCDEGLFCAVGTRTCVAL